MLNFNYHLPTNYVFGKGTEKQVGELTAAYTEKKKILVVYGSSRIEKNGLLETIENSLHQEGIALIKLPGVQANPVISLVRKGVAIVKKEGIDFILAIGGGSVLDTAKAIACGACYDGDISDMLNAIVEPQTVLPVGVVLTLSATGSESSNCAVITVDSGEKGAICHELIRPKFAVMNPELTCSVSKWHTACGSSDILAHALEAYFTKTADVDLTDELIEGLCRTIIKYAPIAVENPNDYNARAQLMWCGALANNGFFQVDRIADTASHALAEHLGAELTHGATLTAIIPALMLHTYKRSITRYVRYAEKIWGIDISKMEAEEAALAGIEATKEFFHKLGAPVSLKELGLDPKLTPAVLAEGDWSGWNEVPGFFFELDEEDRRRIYELAAE